MRHGNANAMTRFVINSHDLLMVVAVFMLFLCRFYGWVFVSDSNPRIAALVFILFIHIIIMDSIEFRFVWTIVNFPDI